jgi:hypothetical protein
MFPTPSPGTETDPFSEALRSLKYRTMGKVLKSAITLSRTRLKHNDVDDIDLDLLELSHPW